MRFWNSFSGMERIEIVCADAESLLSEMMRAGIELFVIESKDHLTWELTVFRKDIDTITQKVSRRGGQISSRKKLGVFWNIKNFLKRPVLIVGIVLLAAMMYFVSTRILFIEVTGNSSIAKQKILSAAELCGIYFGVPKLSIRNEDLNNTLQSQIPEIKWAGVNIHGCIATISVQEGNQVEKEKLVVQNMVAAKDGVVSEYTINKGTSHCEIGQAVRKGQVLISPYVDCGIKILVSDIAGEVYAYTKHQLEMIAPTQCVVREKELYRKYAISLILGKKKINLWKYSGIYNDTCGRMYKEYSLIFPGGFVLPISIAVDTVMCSNHSLDYYEYSEGQLLENMLTYLKTQMIAGKIMSYNTGFSATSDTQIMKGSFICNEMIGRLQQEKIGEYNGQTN